MRSLADGNAKWVEAEENKTWDWIKEVAERRREKGR